MRRVLTTLIAFMLTIVLGAAAVAGGWAVTTLDEVPSEIRAGETYSIGYTIRQHGVTPVNVEETGGPASAIRITSPDGAETLSYQGVREGPTGHYVAKVLFPHEGAWTWQVTQGPFAPQELGPLTVLPAVGAAQPGQGGAPGVASAPQPAANPFLVSALLLATAGAAVLFGTRVLAVARRRATA